MKRNLFAIFLALTLVVAMVFVIAPIAKAEETTVVTAQADGEIAFEEGKILDLNGKTVTVAVPADKTLYVIDTANKNKDGVTGAGKLTNSGAGSVATVSQDPDSLMRYFAVKTGDTYACHPFNLTISQLGLNTKKEAICLRATFMANDAVISKIDDYGLWMEGEDHSVEANYPFTANLINAYADLTGSLVSDVAIDVQKTAKAYITIDGETVYSTYEAKVTPRQVLKSLNSADIHPTDTQKAAMEKLAEIDHLSDLFTSITGTSCGHKAEVPATCVAQGICKNCDAVTAAPIGKMTGHKDANGDRYCDNEGCGSIVTTPNQHTHVNLAGDTSSDSWEITGTMLRPKGSSDQWNFGFDIYDENGKALVFSATSGGLIFERVQGQYSRYPYHFNGLSQYNLSDATDGFHQANNQNDTLYFRAIIENDVFYAWFGYTEDNMVLTWMIPLAEELTGRWGATLWADFNDPEYEGDDKSVPFSGFEAGSKYRVAMHVNSTPSASASINDMVIKTGAEAGKSGAKFTTNLIRNYTSWDYMNGTLVTKSGVPTQAPLVGDSKTWEITGTLDRSGTENLNFGFMIGDGSKTLRISAVTAGPVFEAADAYYGHNGHGRFAYHAFGKSQYNLSTHVSQFLDASKGVSQVKFKAMIANDMFYVWFWYGDEQPTLSWVIPLTETLKGVEGGTAWTDNLFTGFAPGSSYKMTLFTNATSSVGTYSDLTVKTDVEVPKFVLTNTPSGTVDAMTGYVKSEAAQITNLDFAGSCKTWEISGTMSRPDKVGTLSFMFNLASGSKTLNITAATNGIVFGEDGTANGYSREPYHCFGVTQYNLRPINEFLTAKITEMYFKVIIANDTFYAYFWYEGEAPTLAWKIPLAEQLYGPNGAAWTGGSPFMGFGVGSAFTMNMRIRGGADAAISNLTVKTGAGVDTSVLSAN